MKLNCNKFLLGFIYGIKIFKKQKKLPIRQLRIHLLAKRALCVGHAGNAAVQAVQNHRAENTNRCLVKTPIHRHHNCVKPAEQPTEREQVGQNIDALAPLAHHHVRGLDRRLFAIMHKNTPVTAG